MLDEKFNTKYKRGIRQDVDLSKYKSYIGTWTKTKEGYEWKYLPKGNQKKVKKKSVYDKVCKVCNLRAAISKHHLKPKSMGGNKKVKICIECHREINNYFSNWELAKLFREGIFPTTQTFNDMLNLRRNE